MRTLNMADLRSGLALDGHHVATGGVATIQPGERSHPEGSHVHPDPEIFLVLAGPGRILINDVGTAFRPGDVLVVEPGEDHHLECAGPEPVVVTWLHLEPVAP